MDCSSSLLELLSPELERECEGEGRKGSWEGARGGVAEGGRERMGGKGEEGGETGAELERSRGESWGSGTGLSRQLWRRAALSKRAW